MPAAATERAREAALDAMQTKSAFARLVLGVDVDGAEEQAAHATFGPLLTVLSGRPSADRHGRRTARAHRAGGRAQSGWSMTTSSRRRSA
jgi:hypothetical protein